MNLRIRISILILIGAAGCMYSQDHCRTGYISPSVTGNVSYGNPINWASPNKSITSDNDYASSSLSLGDTSKYLRINDFSFELPSSATVTGLAARMEKHMDSGGAIKDASVKLLINNVISGIDHLTPASVWPVNDSIMVYGGQSDLWGLTLTPMDINSTDFGVLISACRISGTGTKKAYVDDVRLEIFFSTPDGEGCAPYSVLPVNLLGFSGKYMESSGSILEWKTAREINNAYFTIERSYDGIAFCEIGKIRGAGNSSSVMTYGYSDPYIQHGINYYRICQTDYDQKKKVVSDVISVLKPNLYFDHINIFPNPASSFITVDGIDPESEVFLINTLGQIIFYSNKNFTSRLISLAGKPRGAYLLKIIRGTEIFFRKIIVI